MGISLSQALAAKRAVRVVVATNQENGTVSYHTGTLRYEEAGAIGPYFRPARLTTSGGKPLTALFSDRFVGGLLRRIDRGAEPVLDQQLR